MQIYAPKSELRLNARALAAKGRYREARELFDRLIESNPGEIECPELALEAARFFEAAGAVTKAAKLVERILHVSRDNLTAVIRCKLLHELAVIRERQGEILGALSLLKRCVSLSYTATEPAESILIMCHTEIGNCHEALGNFVTAERTFRKVLAITLQHGNETEETVSARSRLAWCLKYQGKFEPAKELLLESISISKRLFGNNHRSLIKNYSNFAGILYAQGDIEAGRAFLHDALRIAENILGRTHPTTAELVNNMARLREMEGNAEQAEALYLRALAIRHTCLGEEHPDYAVSLNNLANLYHCPYRSPDLYREAERILVNALGSEHPHVRRVRENRLTLQADFAIRVDSGVP